MSILWLVYLNRTIPQLEIDAVSEFLFHLLTGDVDKLPTQTLVQKFWSQFHNEQKQAAKYVTCLRTHQLTEVECYRVVRVYCGSRFGQETPERLEQCHRLLANEINATTVGVDHKTIRSFENYHSCFKSYRRLVRNCTDVLRKVITDRRLRATKVVRATMDSMGPLLRALPTLRVIHLVRDPRAVALSRIRFDDSGRGIYTLHIPKSESHIVAEASLYCHHVTANIRSGLALQREFPDRILTLRYEDVVANPEQRFRDIYKLLDESVPKATLEEMQKLAQEGRASNLSTKWQSKVTYDESITIARQCADFFSLLNISAVDW